MAQRKRKLAKKTAKKTAKKMVRKTAKKSAKKAAKKSVPRPQNIKTNTKTSTKTNAKTRVMTAASLGKVAEVLTDSLPYLRTYVGKPVVVKVGGQIVDSPERLSALATDLVLARQVGVRPLLVHGGAPQIKRRLADLGKEPKFLNGLRVTDTDTARIVERTLSGEVNKQLVAAINAAGGRAVGISGRDGGLIDAVYARPRTLGYVGSIQSVQIQLPLALEQAGMIPVVSPVTSAPEADATGVIPPLNINADSAASALAAALGAVRLLVATDVAGLRAPNGVLVKELTRKRAEALLQAPSTQGGMRPKLAACIAALEAGVEAAVILDGRVPHALLLELFTSGGGGTLIRG